MRPASGMEGGLKARPRCLPETHIKTPALPGSGPDQSATEPAAPSLLMSRTGPWRVASEEGWRVSAARVLAPEVTTRPGCRARLAGNFVHDRCPPT